MAGSGAGAVVAVINLQNNKLYSASVGGCICMVVQTTGSFSRSLTEAVVVADGRKFR